VGALSRQRCCQRSEDSVAADNDHPSRSKNRSVVFSEIDQGKVGPVESVTTEVSVSPPIPQEGRAQLSRPRPSGVDHLHLAVPGQVQEMVLKLALVTRHRISTSTAILDIYEHRGTVNQHFFTDFHGFPLICS
jgi:hypothetical protein